MQCVVVRKALFPAASVFFAYCRIFIEHLNVIQQIRYRPELPRLVQHTSKSDFPPAGICRYLL